MSWEGWFTLAVALATLVLLAKEIYAPASTLLGATILLLVVGVITPTEAFSGFGNSAPITVAALYILARGVEKTNLLQPLLSLLLGRGKTERASLSRLLPVTGGASAFLNNTPLVAMLIGPITDWAERSGKSPSRYLMPLSFAVILGGVVTVMGTSTNLVVSGMLESHGQAPMGIFEISPMGVPVALAGFLILIVTAPFLLPERRPARKDLDSIAREFTVNMMLEPGGPLDGKPVGEGGLRHLQGVFLVEVLRAGVSVGRVGPNTVLRGGDQLCFVGRVDQIVDLQSLRGLVSAEQTHLTPFDTVRNIFLEAVIGATSPLVGKTLREVDFRRRYQAAVVAIHRAGHRINAKLGQVDLKVGDTLVLLADRGFRDRWRDRSDFLLVSPLSGTPPAVTKKAGIVGLITVAIVIVAGLGILPMLQASLIGAIALVAFGVLTAVEARNAVDLDVIIMIAASFGVGAAMDKSGLASVVADLVIGGFGGLGTLGTALGILLATIVVTEIITNNAAAALMFPIAFASAEKIGQDPRVFAMVVAVAASCSFLTPIGYQTNTMVYGPGGYRFGDYARLGIPLTICVIVTTLLVLKFWYGL
jgi:di/tricarboxylate transporter